MAKKRRKWQRGTADMVSIGVGMILLGIVTAGTSAAMVYGREAMIREEHYKAAAYILRGYMEQAMGELELVPQARTADGLGPQSYTRPLDVPGDRNHVGVRVMMVTVAKDPVVEGDDMRNGSRRIGQIPDYYHITMHARWTERDYAEDRSGAGNGIQHEISMETGVLPRALLQ